MLQEAVGRTAALMAQLNAATAAIRDDRELLAGRVSWLDYRLYLVRMYGFHAPVEHALTAYRPLTAVVADAGLRNHKTALLAHDLVALGADRRDLLQAPRMAFTASMALPEALGWTYVVESMTLRNKLVAQRLARHLPAEIQRASAYLRCYGDEAVTRWRELGSAFDAFPLHQLSSSPAAAIRSASRPLCVSRGGTQEPSEDSSEASSLALAERACDRVIDAARDGLLQLRRWLGPVLQPRTTQRHA
jgi:heme oxygenase